MEDLIRRSDAIKAIHNYWKKRLDTLPTKESEYGEVYADIQQMDKILEHNKILCNFINAIPSAESTGDLDNAIYEYVKEGLMANPYNRPQGENLLEKYPSLFECSVCGASCFDTIPWDCNINYCPNCGARMKGADDGIR